MRKNLGIKPYILPMPVLIIGTYDKDGKANAMNAAWGTVCDMDKVSIYLAGEHKTVKNLLQTKAFTVSIADKNNVVSADYVGIVSGNKEPNNPLAFPMFNVYNALRTTNKLTSTIHNF